MRCGWTRRISRQMPRVLQLTTQAGRHSSSPCVAHRHRHLPLHRHRRQHQTRAGAPRGVGICPPAPSRHLARRRGDTPGLCVPGHRRCICCVPNGADADRRCRWPRSALPAESWGETPIRVRMGMHTGAAVARDGDYQGYLTLAHVQRVMSAAYGGQTLVSDATAGLLRGQLPEGITLRDMGEHRLKGLLNPEHLWQSSRRTCPPIFHPCSRSPPSRITCRSRSRVSSGVNGSCTNSNSSCPRRACSR